MEAFSFVNKPVNMGRGSGPSCSATPPKSSHPFSHQEPLIDDDEFDAMWENAVAEAARILPGQRPLSSEKIISRSLGNHDGDSVNEHDPTSSKIHRKSIPMSNIDKAIESLSRRAHAAAAPVNRDRVPVCDDILPGSEVNVKSSPNYDVYYVPTKGSMRTPGRDKIPTSFRSCPSLDTGFARDGGCVANQDDSKRASITFSDDLDHVNVQRRRRTAPIESSESRTNQSTSLSTVTPEQRKYMKKSTLESLTSELTVQHSLFSSDHEGEDIDSALPISFKTPMTSENGGESVGPRKFELHDLQIKAAKYVLKRLSSVTDNTQKAPLFSLPSVHSISAFKETRDQLSGLVISRDANSEVIIHEISKTSIFAETPLRRGHEILTINDLRVKCPRRATKIVKSIKGEVNLLVSEGTRPPGARYVRAKIGEGNHEDSIINLIFAKSSNNPIDELGVALESKNGLVRVARVDEGNFLGDTKLQLDDIILAVNGESARDVDTVNTLLLESHRKGGVVNILVYSIVDLRLGLVDRIIKSPWEARWDKDFTEAIVSWPTLLEGGCRVSFCFDFLGWKCKCTPVHCDNPLASEFANEMNLAKDEFNRALKLVSRSLKDAINSCTPNQNTASC